MNNELKNAVTILLADSLKITNDVRKQMASIVLRHVVQNPSKTAPMLMAPVGHLLREYKGAIDTDYHAALFTIFVAIADEHPKESIGSVVPFIDAIMHLCGQIKKTSNVTSCDVMFDLIVQMAEILLDTSKPVYTATIFELDSLPLVSALINQLLYVCVSSTDKLVQTRAIGLLVRLFNSSKHKNTSLILSTIFPGLFTHLTRVIDPLNKSFTTAARCSALDALGKLTLIVLTPFQIPANPPVELRALLPLNCDAWREATRSKVMPKLFELITRILSSDKGECVSSALSMMAKLTPVMDGAFKREFINACGYALQSDVLAISEMHVRQFLKEAKLTQSDILVIIHETFTDNVKQLVRAGGKTRLIGASGLLQLVNQDCLGVFINLEQLVAEVLKRLIANFGAIVPGLAEMTTTQVQKHNDARLEFTKLGDFCPISFERVEWDSFSLIFGTIGRNAQLADECFDIITAHSRLNLSGVIILATWLAQSSESIPAHLARSFSAWSQQIDADLNLPRRDKIGMHMLQLLVIQASLPKADTESKSILLFEVFVACASDEFQIADFGLAILRKEKKTEPNLFDTYLNSIMSRLMRRFRQVEQYPNSGSIMAILVGQIELTPNVEFVLVSAFEEVVKLVDISSGRHLAYYIPALVSLKSLLLSDQVAPLIDALLDRVRMVLGPSLTPSANIACIDTIGLFIGQTSDKERLILIATLFPVLMRRLDSDDLRIARHVPQTLLACYRCSGDFLAGRVYGTLMPRLVELLNRRKGNFMTYSAEFKFVESMLAFIVDILPEMEVTEKRVDMWRCLTTCFSSNKLTNAEFREPLAKCNRLLTEKWAAHESCQ